MNEEFPIGALGVSRRESTYCGDEGARRGRRLRLRHAEGEDERGTGNGGEDDGWIAIQKGG